MKSDEWRTWCLAVLPFVLKGRLPVSVLNNWAIFVGACQILCRPSITVTDANFSHHLLQEFTVGMANLCDKNAVTPNMHMHLHLRKSIQDFGPIYTFWVYGFKRFNGDIKLSIDYKKLFEVTYMRKFLTNIHFNDYIQHLPDEITSNQIMISTLNLFSSSAIFSSLSSSSSELFDYNNFLSAYIGSQEQLNGSELLPMETYSSMNGIRKTIL